MGGLCQKDLLLNKINVPDLNGGSLLGTNASQYSLLSLEILYDIIRNSLNTEPDESGDLLLVTSHNRLHVQHRSQK